MKIPLLFLLSACSFPAFAQSIPDATDSLRSDILDEVVITGQFEPRSAKNSVYRVRTITTDQIRLKGATNVESILQSQIGIRFSNDLMLGESDIELMGMSGQNVKVLIDGIPVIDRGATKQSLSQVDINNIARIEIVEGPMSVIYGTDALAGVINIITVKHHAKNILRISGRIQEESAGSEYQVLQHEGTHNGNISIDWAANRWQARLSGSKNSFGGWKGNSSGRALDWNPKDQWLASLGLGYQFNSGEIYYRADFLDEDIYIPGPLNETNLRAVDKNYLSNRLNHVLQARWKIHEKIDLQSSLSQQHYRRDTRTVRHDFMNGDSELTSGAGEQDRATFSSTMLRATLRYSLSDAISLQPGFDVQRIHGTGERISSSPSISDYAFFLSSELRLLDFLNLRPGLRFIHNSIYNAPPVIPSLNAKVKLSNTLDLRTAYARGFRSPALRELYFTFVDANHSISGNPSLKAEFSHSFNSYLTWQGFRGSRFSFESTVGGFFNRFHNMIALGTVAGNGSANTYLNIDQFRTAGAVFENKFSRGNFDGTLGFSFIGRYNRLSADEEDVPGMVWSPELNSMLHYRVPAWQASLNLYYKLNGKRPGYEVTSTGDAGSAIARTSIAAHHLADLTINKTLCPFLSLTGGVRNLFDITSIQNTANTEGAAHASATGQIPVSYGRSYFLGLTFQWTRAE